MSKIVQEIEQEQMVGIEREQDAFAAGDTVCVNVWVKEGNRKRIQAFEGVVIAKRNRGLNSSFIARKVSHGEGIERAFQLYSPLIESIRIKRRGAVRRAKLYYLRSRRGKAARIREKIRPKSGTSSNKLG